VAKPVDRAPPFALRGTRAVKPPSTLRTSSGRTWSIGGPAKNPIARADVSGRRLTPSCPALELELLQVVLLTPYVLARSPSSRKTRCSEPAITARVGGVDADPVRPPSRLSQRARWSDAAWTTSTRQRSPPRPGRFGGDKHERAAAALLRRNPEDPRARRGVAASQHGRSCAPSRQGPSRLIGALVARRQTRSESTAAYSRTGPAACPRSRPRRCIHFDRERARGEGAKRRE